MPENPFAVLGLTPGPADDGQVAAAYERRLAECRKRIRDENVRAAAEERLIYAYAVLRDPQRRAAYLARTEPQPPRLAEPEAPPAPPEPAEPPEPHGKNKPQAIRGLCATIDSAIIDGEIDPLRRRAIHARARILGVTVFEAELLIASALARVKRREGGDPEPADPPKSKLALLITCLGILLLAILLYARL